MPRGGTYVGQSLVLLLQLVVGGEQRLLHLVQVVLELLHLLLQLVDLVLGLQQRAGYRGAGVTGVGAPPLRVGCGPPQPRTVRPEPRRPTGPPGCRRGPGVG